MADDQPTFPSSPQVPVKSTKAIVAAIGAALSGGIVAAISALEDNAITSSEWLGIILAVLVGSGVTGAATWAAKNNPK
jgi:hypothetical protein